MARCLRCKAGNEWIEGDVKPEKAPRLTKIERRLLISAARLVLAGEWPWEPEERGNRDALTSAADKLERSGDKGEQHG